MKNQHKPLFWMTVLTLFGAFLGACSNQPLPTATSVANLGTATSTAVPTFTPSFTPAPTSTPSAPNLVATSLLAIPTTGVTKTPRPTYTPLPPSVTPTPLPTATTAFVSPVDLSATSLYQGAGIAPDKVGNLQKLNSWGKGAVIWARYSPDGSQAAVLTEEKFYLYQAGSDNEIYAISVPAGQWFVNAAASSDWQWLALGLNDERVLVYTLANNSFQYEINSQAVVGMQFLPQSTILLTREWGWDVATNQPVTTNFPGGVISADGQTVAYEAGANFQLGQLTWANDTLQFQPTQQIRVPNAPITGLALSPDGSKFTFSSWHPTIEVWDTQTAVLLYTLNVQYPEQLTSEKLSKSRRFSPAKFSGPGRYFGASVAFSPDGKWLIAHNMDNDLLFWEADTGKFVQRWADAEKNISFTADLTEALTWDGSVTEWSKTGEKLFEQPAHLPWIWDLTFLPHNQIALGSTDIVLLNAPELQPLARLNGRAFRLASLPDGETLVYSHHEEIIFHHLPSGRITSQYHPYRSPWDIRFIEVSPDGRWLATRVRDELGRVWWLEDWNMQLESGDFEPDSQFLTFTSDSQYVVVAENSENVIQFWSLQPAEAENTLPLHHSIPYGEDWYIGRVIVSPDNQFLLMNNFVMDLQTETVVATLPTWGDEVVFTPDGQLLLMITDNNLQLWNTADWSLIREIEMDKQPRNFAVSADGKLIAIAFDDGLIELWGIPQP